jgi:hypothetical protein
MINFKHSYPTLCTLKKINCSKHDINMLEKKFFVKKKKSAIICNFPNVLKDIVTLNSNF